MVSRALQAIYCIFVIREREYCLKRVLDCHFTVNPTTTGYEWDSAFARIVPLLERLPANLTRAPLFSLLESTCLIDHLWDVKNSLNTVGNPSACLGAPSEPPSSTPPSFQPGVCRICSQRTRKPRLFLWYVIHSPQMPTVCRPDMTCH